MRFNDFRIGTRLTCGFLAIVAIFIASAIFQIFALYRLGNLQDEGAHRAADAVDVGHISSRLAELYGVAADAIINGDVNGATGELADVKSQFSRDFADLRQRLDTTEEHRALTNLESIMDEYFTVIEGQLFPLLQKEGSAINQRVRDIDGRIDDIRRKAAEPLQVILESLIDEMREADEIFDSTRQKSTQYAIFFSALALALGMVLGFVITMSIIRPLKKGVVFAEHVAAGKLDEKLDVDQKDEVGVLAAALRKMVHNLNAMISGANDKARIAKEESERAHQATNEANQAKQRAEHAQRDGMRQAAESIEGVVERMTSASEELSAQVEEASRGAEEQTSRTGETATAMEEMNPTVLEVAKNASNAAEASDMARTKAVDGAKVVSDSVEAINTVQVQAQDMKNNLDQLGRQADQIGRIMNVIEDIADQTNLLALNAAIEAARAGDAGRGFAVVADEVRKLAEKTMNATKEVGEAISAIQQGTQANIRGMDQSVGAIENATRLANQSGDALREILALAEQAADQVRSIATAAEQQSATSEEINRGVEDINRISSETSEVMNQSAQAISELAQQAGELQKLVREMKNG